MSLATDGSANAAQIDYWNAKAGETWAQYQAQLDRQIEPLGLEAMRILAPGEGEAVLDIGCGCGQSSLSLASRVGPDGFVLGVDISRPMLEVARRRAEDGVGLKPSFVEVDAQGEDLGEGRFDVAYSRFGVMFFSDPVAAFRNIRKSLRPGGRLGFVCWRPMAINALMQAPLEAALPYLPALPPTDPLAPGPFAFADPDRVRAILSDAGFAAVTVDPFDARIGGSDLDQTVELTFRIGPLGAALRERPDLAPVVRAAVRNRLAEYETPQGVLMPAAVWIVQARNP